MTFRELLELYRSGELDEERCREVEEAVDREDAILEYLAERDALPEPEAGFAAPADDAETEKKFQKELQRGIRRAFVRLGLCVGCVLLAALLLILFVLPHAVDLFYYDPGEIAASVYRENTGSVTDVKTNRMSLDLAVYSELFLPGAYREHVNVYDRGYGEYDIVVVQNVTVTGRFTDVAGRIGKNRLIFYDTNTLKAPVGNAFEWGVNMPDPDRSLTQQIREPELDENGAKTMWSVGMAGYPEDARDRLEELPDGQYRGFVSLDRVMDYEDFRAFLQRRELGGVWCAVQVAEKPGYAENYGFCTDYGNGGNILCWDREKYPLLKRDGFSDTPGSFEIETEEDARTHMISLLRYLNDQPRFRAMMEECLGRGGASAEPMIKWLEEHGVRVYGFSLIADKETLLALQDCPEVYAVAAQPIW